MIVLRLDLYAEWGTQVVSAGQFLYVACHGDILPFPGTAGIRGFSISQPENPRLVVAHNIPGHAQGLAIHDSHLLVAAGRAGLYVFRRMDPEPKEDAYDGQRE